MWCTINLTPNLRVYRTDGMNRGGGAEETVCMYIICMLESMHDPFFFPIIYIFI